MSENGTYKDLFRKERTEKVEIEAGGKIYEFELRNLSWSEIEDIKDECTIIREGSVNFSQKNYKFKRLIKSLIKHPFPTNEPIQLNLERLDTPTLNKLNSKIEEMAGAETEKTKN